MTDAERIRILTRTLRDLAQRVHEDYHTALLSVATWRDCHRDICDLARLTLELVNEEAISRQEAPNDVG